MAIEIRNYNTSISSKSLMASFDLVFRDWGIIIRDCKLFHGKENKRWFIMPAKSTKNGDGTWGKPIPYVEFANPDMHYKIQSLVLQAIDKLSAPPPETPNAYYPSGCKKGEYFEPELSGFSTSPGQNPSKPSESPIEDCPF